MKAKQLAEILLQHPETELYIDHEAHEWVNEIVGAYLAKRLTDGGQEAFEGIVLVQGLSAAQIVDDDRCELTFS